MASAFDLEEKRRCLKAANLFDENMSDENVEAYYDQLKKIDKSDMENTVKELEEVLNSSSETLKRNLSDSEEESSIMEFKMTKFNNNLSLKTSDKSWNLIGYHDMPPGDTCDVKLVEHKLKFVNVQNSPTFLTASKEQRINMLIESHTSLNRLRSCYLRTLPVYAPRGKPITPSITEMSINPTIGALQEEESSHEEYVCRSGRRTKRKVYNEMEEPLSPKRSKTWLSKPKSKDKEDLEEEVVPKPKTYQKKPPYEQTPRKGRIANLLDAAKEERDKKVQQEKEISKFTDSLRNDSGEEDEQDEVINVDAEVERRRVVPRMPKLPISRKPINGNPEMNGNPRRPTPQRSTPSTSTARPKKAETATCPICSGSFPVKMIEEHASTCGEEVFPQWQRL